MAAALGSSFDSSEAAGAAAGVGAGAEAGAAAAGAADDVEPESCTGGLGASEAGGTGAAAAAVVAAGAAVAGLALVPYKVNMQSGYWSIYWLMLQGTPGMSTTNAWHHKSNNLIDLI